MSGTGELLNSVSTHEKTLQRLDDEERSLREKIDKLKLRTKPPKIEDGGNLLPRSWAWPLARGHPRPSPANKSVDKHTRALQAIKRERNEICEQLTACKLSLGWMVIDLLPAEILSQVFVYCVPQEEFRHWGGYADISYLTLVCKRWRTILLDTPDFWASLSLIFAARDIEPQMRQLTTCIQRSGSIPLSLELMWYPPDKDGFAKHLEYFKEHIEPTLAPSFSRWRHISLCLPLHIAMYVLSKKLPSLVNLSLAVYVLKFGMNISEPLLEIKHPSLRQLSIATYYLPPAMEVPWPQITIFKCRAKLTIFQAHAFLEDGRNLRECDLLVGFGHHPANSLRPLLLPIMQSASFGFTHGGNELLRLCTMPNLETLSVNTSTDIDLMEFIERSGCGLRVLRATELRAFDHDSIKHVFKTIPTLVELWGEDTTLCLKRTDRTWVQ